jgi:hypothetical protein
MTVISNKYNYKEGISFLHTIKLSSGVFGKCIEYKGSLTNYIITEFGDVYNIKTERKLKPCILSGPGYYSVNIQLGHHGVYKTMCIHRLIALGYIENKHKYPCVNHIDGNKLNNSIQNLEWVTYSQNNSHAYLLKLKAPRVMDSDSCIFTTHTMDDVSVVCDLLETGFSPKSISEKNRFWHRLCKEYI